VVGAERFDELGGIIEIETKDKRMKSQIGDVFMSMQLLYEHMSASIGRPPSPAGQE
jgi:hypothetical protein